MMVVFVVVADEVVVAVVLMVLAFLGTRGEAISHEPTGGAG